MHEDTCLLSIDLSTVNLLAGHLHESRRDAALAGDLARLLRDDYIAALASNNLAAALIALGDYDQARAQLQRAEASLFSEHVPYRTRVLLGATRGELLLDLARGSEAISALQVSGGEARIAGDTDMGSLLPCPGAGVPLPSRRREQGTGRRTRRSGPRKSSVDSPIFRMVVSCNAFDGPSGGFGWCADFESSSP
jgi:hypothetical protein